MMEMNNVDMHILVLDILADEKDFIKEKKSPILVDHLLNIG
jgi:hypothetical protein